MVTMKAVRLHSSGGVDHLEIDNVTLQNPRNGEALVRALSLAGAVTPQGDAVLPLAAAAAAHERVEHGHVRGKLVLDLVG